MKLCPVYRIFALCTSLLALPLVSGEAQTYTGAYGTNVSGISAAAYAAGTPSSTPFTAPAPTPPASTTYTDVDEANLEVIYEVPQRSTITLVNGRPIEFKLSQADTKESEHLEVRTDTNVPNMKVKVYSTTGGKLKSPTTAAEIQCYMSYNGAEIQVSDTEQVLIPSVDMGEKSHMVNVYLRDKNALHVPAANDYAGTITLELSGS